MIERLVRGDVPKKHHIAHRDGAGALRHEECLTRDGFEGPYTILYHQDRPHTHRVAPVTEGWAAPVVAPADTLKKRHYTTQVASTSTGPVSAARDPLLFNADVVLSVLRPTGADPTFLVNADGDDLYFVHEGGGVLVTPLGDVRFGPLDYVCVPRGLTHRFVLDPIPQRWLAIECRGGLFLPRQWRNEVGQLRMDAPYSHRDFRAPDFTGARDDGVRLVHVKRGDAWSAFTLDHSPLDVVGWDGSVWPFALHILNFQPRAGLVHLPPTWHGTFAARGALICSFVPRLVDFHPEAIPCPYPHHSVDVDEILYYCDGNFTSRRGVGPGSISVHPAGIPHGPHPGAYERSIGSTRTDELAVMLDVIRPLERTPQAAALEDPAYHDSFR